MTKVKLKEALMVDCQTEVFFYDSANLFTYMFRKMSSVEGGYLQVCSNIYRNSKSSMLFNDKREENHKWIRLVNLMSIYIQETASGEVENPGFTSWSDWI